MPLDVGTLRIVHFPHPALLRKSEPVAAITPEVGAVARRMIELMHEAEGVGLAAPQVGLPWRLFVADVPANEDRSADLDPPTATLGPCIYINPVLAEPEGPPEPAEEGCLSLPEIRGDVLRPPIISVTALDLEGRPFTRRAGGLLARCWQHENDHLDGVLIIDKMNTMSRLRNRAAIRRLERDADG
ncbi:MAG: peptide deformylase [Phycisphaerae bacterium]|nr:peptide deformylase [Phycisphaerae bacterium]